MTLPLSDAVEAVEGSVGPTQGSGSLHTRRSARWSVLSVASLVFLILVVLTAIVAPFALPGIGHQYAGNLLDTAQSPSWHHLLGTDSEGRDILERLLVGTRITVVGVFEGVGITLLLAVPVGIFAGYVGGKFDKFVSWLADLMFSVPAIVVIVLVLSIFRTNLLAAMGAFGLLTAPAVMRVVRSVVLQVREELYISAAVVAGLSRSYILTRHVLPRLKGVLIVQVTILSAVAVLIQSGLAFLGLLAIAPTPSWGGMVADGTQVITQHPWLIWPPGLAIILVVMALSFVAEAFQTGPSVAPPLKRGAQRRSYLRRSSTIRGDEVSVSLSADSLLEVRGLSVDISSGNSRVTIIDDVTFNVGRGETVGLVGESGCGKSMTASSLIGLLPVGGRIESGSIFFDGEDISQMSERQLRAIRGKKIGFVAQEPMIALNPSLRVGVQLAELVKRHQKVSRRRAKEITLDLLESVHLPDPPAVARRYPFELSGGMVQRVCIARALAGDPKLLIADEPTTALDVTVQQEILDLLSEIQVQRGMSVLLITHDWGVIANSCQRSIVMYAGQVVETGSIEEVVLSPSHPYTSALLRSDPHNIEVSIEPLPVIAGTVPQPGEWGVGCRFAPRCDRATVECLRSDIPITELSARREVRCIWPLEELA